MNNHDKKEWIIKYIKKNKLDDILAEKYKSDKINFFKKYSIEIQSICTIISVIGVGIISLIISVQNVYLVQKQTQIMKLEQKPLIDIEKNSFDDYTDKLLVINKGADTKNYNIEIITYLDVACNENQLGTVPIRAYFVIDGTKLENGNANKLAEITLHNETYPKINSLKKGLHDIVSKYTNLYWGFSLKYLIIVTTTDVIGETNVDYFLLQSKGLNRVDEGYGSEVVAEYSCMIGDDLHKTSKEIFFDLENNDPNDLFKYILKKIRDKNMYTIDFHTDNKYLYGDYEPSDNPF